MPSWKKVILSGSNASLSTLTTIGNVSGSATSTGSFGNISIVGFPNVSQSLAAADTLGDHLATQNLNLQGNEIESASRVLANAISGSSITASIGTFADLLATFVSSSNADFNRLTSSLLDAEVITVTQLRGGSPLEITASNFIITKSGSLTLSGSSTASFDRIIGSGKFSLGNFTDVSTSLSNISQSIVPSGSVFVTQVSRSVAQFGFGQGAEVTALSNSLQSRIVSNKDDIDQLQGAGNTQGVGESNTPIFAGLTINGTITGSIISASAITASDISSLIEGIDISNLSQSLASRLQAEEGEAEGSVISSSTQIASAISGSLGANASLIRSLNATGITGSFTATSGGLATRVTNFVDGTVTLVSGSGVSTGSFGHLMHEGKSFDDAVSESVAQFGFGQGAEVTALSQSLQNRVRSFEEDSIVSSSTQIASSISGSLSATAIAALGARIISASSDTVVDLNGKKILFSNVYSTEGDLPSATDNHGMFAHVHGTGLAYFAHAGNWVKLALYSGNISSSAQIASDISGSFLSLSQSLADRLQAEEGEAEGSVISSSLQIASAISGSFSKVHLSSKVPNIVSSSTQIASSISGSLSATAIAALGAGIVSGSGQVNDILPDDLLSGSAQIASDISGSFNAASNSIAIDINSLQSSVTTLESGATATVISQSVASATWAVTHSLGTKYPAITVWDGDDNVIVPSNIKADTSDTLTISFTEAVSGKASITLGAGGINSDSFNSTVSASLVSRIDSNKSSINTLNAKTIISSSGQLSSAITGAFAAASGGFSNRLQVAEAELSLTLLSGSEQVEALLPTGTVSGSSQITDVVTQTYISQSAAAAGFGSGGGGGGGGSGIFTSGAGISQRTLSDVIITGSVSIEASGSETGSTLFDVVGNSGTLFQLNDISSGSLFAVNKASGVPIVESFSDGKTEIGPFNNKVIIDGNISGSASSTASFGALLVNGSTVGGITSGDIANLGIGIISGSSQLPSGTISGSSQLATAISGSLGSNASLIRSLNATGISGSFNTGFEFTGTISGSGTSTGSFGLIRVGGNNFSTAVSESAAAHGFGSGGGGGGGIFTSGSGITERTLRNIFVTGSISIEASGSETGSTLFDVVGNSGTLFQLNDISSGSLFAVNKASGVPIVESFSDGKTEIGPFNNKVIIDGNVSGSATSTGSFGQLLIDGSEVSKTGISGSWRGELSSSNQKFVGGGVSGSATSTASFGYIELNGSKVTAGGGTVTEVEGTGTVSGITLSGTVTTNGQLSLGGSLTFDSSNRTAISGAFAADSHSLQGRIESLSTGAVTAASIRAAEAGVLSGSAQIASAISGSLGTNATLIRSLTAAGISGSLAATTIANLAAGIVSSSTQISASGFITSASAVALGFGSGGGGSSFTATGITGSFAAASGGFSNRIGTDSGSFSTRVTSLESGGGGGGSGIFTSGAGISQRTLSDIIVTGSMEIKASGSAEGNTLLNTNGNAGSILQLTDDLSTTLFSIAKPSGLPVMEVSASGRVALGPFGSPILIDVNGHLSGSGTSTGSFGHLIVDGTTITPTTATSIAALNAGIISGSSQLPSGIISGSSQLPSGTISGSSQLPSGIVSSSTQISASGFITSASAAALGFGSGGGGSSIFTAGSGNEQKATADMIVTGSITAKSTGSNTTIFSVDGVSEDMLTITDSLSGSLFSVVRTSGIPVMEVFSDGKVQLANLPTSDPGEPGMLYNDSGTLKISL